MLASQDPSSQGQKQRHRIQKRLEDAETPAEAPSSAIEAGVNPAALVDVINEAEATRAAAQSELDNLVEPEVLTDAAIWAMIDSLGDVGAALEEARPERLSTLYESLRLELRYKPDEQTVEVTATPRVGNECVRGRSCALSTRRVLNG